MGSSHCSKTLRIATVQFSRSFNESDLLPAQLARLFKRLSLSPVALRLNLAPFESFLCCAMRLNSLPHAVLPLAISDGQCGTKAFFVTSFRILASSPPCQVCSSCVRLFRHASDCDQPRE